MDKYKFNDSLDRIRNGDTNGLEPLYNEYHGKMTYAAMTVLNDYHEAADIASEILLYILNNANLIRYIDYPDTWMIRLAKYHAVDFVRHDSKAIKTNCVSVFKDSRTMKRAYLYFEISDALKALPDNMRELFDLHYIYGYKYREIAVMLKTPIGTIKRQIYDIKKQISSLKKLP